MKIFREKEIPKKHLCSCCKLDMRKHRLDSGCKCNSSHHCAIATSNRVLTDDERNDMRLDYSYYSAMRYKEDHN